MEIKIGGKTRLENLLKQLFHLPLLDMKWSDNQLALRARLLIYHFISNAGSWNNCYISEEARNVPYFSARLVPSRYYDCLKDWKRFELNGEHRELWEYMQAPKTPRKRLDNSLLQFGLFWPLEQRSRKTELNWACSSDQQVVQISH